MNTGNIIEIKNLTKSFKDFKAVDDISINIRRGEIFAFLGPNGAGKSTTIKMLTTLLQPDSGTIRIDGLSSTERSIDVRRTFGIVFQDPSLDDELTAYENMQLHAVLYSVPKDKMNGKIEELLKFVDLWDRKDSKVREFSGGMKRRLEIARGFLHLPKIIFLDEPTIGLDPQTRNHIWNYIKELNQKENVTIFFTTHYMDEAEKIADRIAIIDHGKIRIEGTLDDIKKETQTETLEDAFLSLTGKEIRDDAGSSLDQMRMMAKNWRKRK